MAGRRAATENPTDAREAHSVPGIHALHVAELLERWEIQPEEFLGPLGLTPSELADPAFRLSIPALERLIVRARTLTGEPGLGFYMGLQMRISAHGYLGFAAMTAKNLREALELASRFTPTRTTALDLRLEEHDDRAFVVIEKNCSLGSIEDAVIFALMVGLWQIGNSLTGRELTGSADIALPEPSYASRFAGLAPGELRYSQPAHRLVFDRKSLDLPLMMSDAGALRLAREQCERELDRLGYQRGLLARVRAVLGQQEGALPTLEAIASDLGTSGRTLKRKLADEGTSYSDLVDEVQKGRAFVLLRSELTVDEIADRLGYSDAANFTRAFRRWTGQTPKAFRKG